MTTSRLACAVLACAAVSGCAAHTGVGKDEAGHSAVSNSQEPHGNGDIRLDRLVAAGFRRALRGARSAQRPRVIDMRHIAPFPWTRWYIFEGATREEMQRVIVHELGFRWRQAPSSTPPLSSATSLVVFATDKRVVSAVPESRIAMGCLNNGHGRSRARSRLRLYRSAGSPPDPASGVPATAPTLVALSSPLGTNVREQRCVQGFGVLH